jgi:hypothetical protein
MGEFAQQSTDIEITFAGTSGLALARRLVVARADPDPRSQTVGTADFYDLTPPPSGSQSLSSFGVAATTMIVNRITAKRNRPSSCKS